MAKYHEIFEDIEALFTDFIDKVEGLQNVNVKILGCNGLKEICKVSKANDLFKHITDVDVIILLNELVFEKLEPEQRQMVVEENVAKIYFDMERDKVVLIQPDVHTFSLLLKKYGYPSYERLNESIKAVYAQLEEEAAQAHN